MVVNGYCGAESGMIPVTTVTPSIFLTEVELQVANHKTLRQPILPLQTFQNFQEPAFFYGLSKLENLAEREKRILILPARSFPAPPGKIQVRKELHANSDCHTAGR